VPRILVHSGHDPVGGDLAGDAPPPVAAIRPFGGFDVLTGDQCQQRQHRPRPLVQPVALVTGERLEQRVRVVDQRRNQHVLRARLIPVDRRLTRRGVVMPGTHRREGLGPTRHQPSDPPDHRDQLGDGVLGGDRVGQDRGVHRPLAAPTQDPGLGDNRAHRVVDPMRTLRTGQALAPVHQRARVEPAVVQRHPGRDLPPQVTPGRLSRLPVRQVMQSLQHQNRGHHRRRDRGPPLARGKQILELPIGKHLLAVLGQEREHAPRRNQMTDQSRRVQKLPIHPLHTLHETILPAQTHNRERHADYSAAS
jgi:hypothetical protein